MSNSGRYLGREGFQAMIGQWEEAWDEFRLEIEDVVEEGDAVVVSVAQYGRGRGRGIEAQMGAAHLMRFPRWAPERMATVPNGRGSHASRA
jgi:ketosteroid isomerase-like protein